jgi:hypothetical protein
MLLHVTHEGEYMQEGWYRFWAKDAWRSWNEQRREWADYSRNRRSMRARLLALHEWAGAAETDHELAIRNGTWVAGLAPRTLPVDLEEGEVGLGTVEGVALHRPGSGPGRPWRFADRGSIHFTNRRMIFSGSEEVSFPFAELTAEIERERGWELSIRQRRVLLAGPVEQLRVLAHGVVDGIAGDDPRHRWTARRHEAKHRLLVVAEERTAIRRAYAQMNHPARPVSPGWIPAGAVAVTGLLGLIGPVAAPEPPPPTVMSIQITTTTLPVEVSEEATVLSWSEAVGDCHASYAGSCVPTGVSDVDCRDSGDDGPYFVGRVDVVGDDVYDLDPDGDGIACDSG